MKFLQLEMPFPTSFAKYKTLHFLRNFRQEVPATMERLSDRNNIAHCSSHLFVIALDKIYPRKFMKEICITMKRCFPVLHGCKAFGEKHFHWKHLCFLKLASTIQEFFINTNVTKPRTCFLQTLENAKYQQRGSSL